MSISLCMIVKNEEDMLDTALTSAEKHVDEIVVVDTGSQDNTVFIAQKHNAKIINFIEEEFSYGRARNVAINNTKADWILFLDADEHIEVNKGFSFNDFLNERSFDACHLWRYNYCPGGGWSGYYMWRVFKNENFRFIGDILEKPVWDGKPNPLEMQTSEVIVHHMGRLKEEKISKEKTEKYIQSVKGLIDSNHTDDLKLYYNILLSMIYCQNNQKDLALNNLEYCKKMNGFEGWLYHRLAGDIYRYCSYFSDAVEEYETALDLSDDVALKSSIHELIGLTNIEMGLYKEAFSGIKKAFDFDNSMPHRYINLGLISILTDDKKLGIELVRKGIEGNKYFADIDLYDKGEPNDLIWECDTPKLFRKMLRDYIINKEL